MGSCRRILDSLELNRGENASLITARYVKSLDDKNASKINLFDVINEISRNTKKFYENAFNFRHKILSLKALPGYFRTIQPLATGLGNSSVLETGLALNPTYGMPFLPGSSIKGITAHYCSETFGLEAPDYRGPDDEDPAKPAGKIYEALFGKIYPEDEQEAGLLRFYDAWITPDCAGKCFVTDVMTPHHGSDFLDPTPINFLTVTGKFELWIGCESFENLKIEADREWVKFAYSLTESALRNYGIGGKIRAGYGKMERVLSPDELKEREQAKKRSESIKSGFTHCEGDIVKAVCMKIKMIKGKEKREFAFSEDTGDKNAVRFEPVPKVNEGESIMAKIIRIDTKNKAYVLQVM